MLWFKKTPSERVPGEKRAETGVRLSGIMPVSAIKIPLMAATKDEAIEELMDCLVQAGSITDREAALQAVRKREAIAPTGIGRGVAIPHGKDATIPELVAALGISKSGIDFSGEDGVPAKVIILIVARTDNPGPHIQALAQIAQMVQAPGFVDKLSQARNPEEALAVISSEE